MGRRGIPGSLKFIGFGTWCYHKRSRKKTWIRGVNNKVPTEKKKS